MPAARMERSATVLRTEQGCERWQRPRWAQSRSALLFCTRFVFELPTLVIRRRMPASRAVSLICGINGHPSVLPSVCKRAFSSVAGAF